MLVLLIRVAATERAPQQHRQDQGEHNHLFECAGPKRTKRLNHAHKQSTYQSAGIAGQTRHHSGHKTFEANQKTLFDDLNNDQTRAELDRLFRYTDADAEKYKDGLWYKAMCFPGKLMRSVFQQHEKWNQGMRSRVLGSYYQHSFAGTQTICWFTGKFESPTDWLNAGYMFARTWLLLTKHNAYLHPFGTLITNHEAYAKMNQLMNTGASEKKLWMIFRAGYSKVPVRSYRLSTKEIIIN